LTNQGPVEDLLHELALQVLSTVLRRYGCGQFSLCEDAARAHLLELAGEAAEAATCTQAARLSTSAPERRYLATQAKRLSSGTAPMGREVDP
jgi:hypothetical protein